MLTSAWGETRVISAAGLAAEFAGRDWEAVSAPGDD